MIESADHFMAPHPFGFIALGSLAIAQLDPATGTLLDLIPEGVSVVAVVATVVLFLRHQREQGAAANQRWADAQAAGTLAAQVAQEAYERSLGRVVEGHRELSQGIHARLDELVIVTRESTTNVERALSRLDSGDHRH